MNQEVMGNEEKNNSGVGDESPRPAPQHGFRLCRARHTEAEFTKPHCECGKSHSVHGFTFQERIFTCGGEDGRYYSKPGGFSNIEYVRADLALATVSAPERETETDQG